MRKLGADREVTREPYGRYIETRPPEVVANNVVCLIRQTNYLLDRQLRLFESALLAEGGLREKMTRARLQARERGRSSE